MNVLEAAIELQDRKAAGDQALVFEELAAIRAELRRLREQLEIVRHVVES